MSIAYSLRIGKTVQSVTLMSVKEKAKKANPLVQFNAPVRLNEKQL